jgi:hypothetical protein
LRDLRASGRTCLSAKLDESLYAVGMGSPRTLERYAWFGGVLYVVALLAEGVLSFGFKVSQNDSAAKIPSSLDDHHRRLILVFCLCILYVAGFVIYLTRLDDLLRRAAKPNMLTYESRKRGAMEPRGQAGVGRRGGMK